MLCGASMRCMCLGVLGVRVERERLKVISIEEG
jgi:hypothetical protein